MNSLGERVKELRNKLHLKQTELSTITGMSQGNISEIEANKKTFSYDAVVSLARYLSDKTVSLYWLLTGEGGIYKISDNINPFDLQLLDDFNNLCEKEKDLVLERIQAYLDLKKVPEIKAKRGNKPTYIKKFPSIPMHESEAEANKIEMRIYDERASAGLGNYLYGDSTYETELISADSIPPKADFGIRISGNSMEPGIPDGSIVWVEERLEIPNGQVGVFVLNNEAYCKRLKIDYDEREVYLLSDNQSYKAIKISEDDFLRTIGMVVGKPCQF